MATFTFDGIPPGFAVQTLRMAIMRAGVVLEDEEVETDEATNGLFRISKDFDLDDEDAGPLEAIVYVDGTLDPVISETYVLDAGGAAAVAAVSIDQSLNNIGTIVAGTASVVGEGIATAEDIAPKRTWRFASSGSPVIASNFVPLAASQAGPATVCFDLDGVLEKNVVVSSVSTPTITGTAATIGTPEIHTSKRKVNIPLTNITATPGLYTVTLTFVATDSEQYMVKGKLQVE